MSIIFVIGPIHENLDKLLYTIDINRKILKENIKHFYIITNNKKVEEYFKINKNDIISCKFFYENQGLQLSCYNSIIEGMKFLLENDNIKNDDIIIFSHEDCYINNLYLFNYCLDKIKKYDIVCRRYLDKYYMNDVFYIKKSIIDEIFSNKEFLYSFNSKNLGSYCEYYFSDIIKNRNIYSILYEHSKWYDSELGFYHMPNYDDTVNKWKNNNPNDLKLLTKYGLETKTDKAYYHLFTEFYNDYFEPIKNKNLNILEIGISNGNSLKMLKKYFKNSIIYGCDNNVEFVNKNYGENIKTLLVDQENIKDIEKYIKDIKFHIIIDDGSHITSQQQKSFGFLFKYLSENGMYILEDLHTSFDKNYIDTKTNTYDMLNNYKNINKINTECLNKDELEYLNNYIKDIIIYKNNKVSLQCYKCREINFYSKNLCINCNTLLNFSNSITSVITKQFRKKIIDTFIFYNELQLLEYRLSILYDIVDYFIIVESKYTFMGINKKLYYDENKNKFEKFKDKIIHIVVEDIKYSNPNINKREQWLNETYQRNCIKTGLYKLDIKDEDIIIISDIDEIPNRDILYKVKNGDIKITIQSMKYDFYYYNLNSIIENGWDKVKILSYNVYKNLNFSIDDIRQLNIGDIIKNSGWHLSYFGDENFIINKIKHFSHQEFNNEYFLNKEKIKNNIENFQDIYDRHNIVKINKISEKDNKNLPTDYDKYLSNFILF